MKTIGTILIVSLCLACAATKEARNVKQAEAGFLGDYSMLKENPGPGARLRYLRGDVDWKRYDKLLLDPVQFWKAADEEAGLKRGGEAGPAQLLPLGLPR